MMRTKYCGRNLTQQYLHGFPYVIGLHRQDHLGDWVYDSFVRSKTNCVKGWNQKKKKQCVKVYSFLYVFKGLI